MRDRDRLALAFEQSLTPIVVPLAPTVPFFLGGVMAGLIGSGLMATAVGFLRYREEAAIIRGLRELDGFGFPVAGYRAWILAKLPTFDVELARVAGIVIVRMGGYIEPVA